LACLAGLLLTAVAAGESLSLERQRAILNAALESGERAIAVARDDPHRAEQCLKDAIGGFEALVAAGVRNPALEFNLGTAYFRLGDIGAAILHYRRAERLGGPAPDLTANLAYVRARVRPQIAATDTETLLARLMFWQSGLSRDARLWAAAGLSVVGWALLTWWLRRRTPALVAGGATLAALGLIIGAGLMWQVHDESRRPAAVVVADEVVLRLGRGDGYDAALREPLGPGVELRIIDERGDWCEVRLANGVVGWLPASAVAKVAG
jgi:tetratricopeptide (TPR) repeat protein